MSSMPSSRVPARLPGYFGASVPGSLAFPKRGGLALTKLNDDVVLHDRGGDTIGAIHDLGIAVVGQHVHTTTVSALSLAAPLSQVAAPYPDRPPLLVIVPVPWALPIFRIAQIPHGTGAPPRVL